MALAAVVSDLDDGCRGTAVLSTTWDLTTHPGGGGGVGELPGTYMLLSAEYLVLGLKM